MGEFQLIDWIRQQAGQGLSGVELGIGDDAAVLSLSADCELVVSTDTLNTGVHFLPDTPPASVGYKALAVNLSDLAAMGATPRWCLLSVSMPENDPAWLRSFVKGFLSLGSEHGVALVGGDTCAGSLSVTVTVLGQVKNGKALTRSGARPGDLVVVSGHLGDAALALSCLLNAADPGENGLLALYHPLPRIALGSSLVGKATSCIDISDGLLADLNHVAEASACGAEIELSRLPASHALAQCESRLRWDLQLAGGDDYELCFTIPQHLEQQLSELSADLDIELTVIGKMVGESGIRCKTPQGSIFSPGPAGYEHFK